MKPIKKAQLLIQDATNNENYFCVAETEELNKERLPKLNEHVFLPISSCLNGFCYKKNRMYLVTEINNNYEEGILYIFLTKIKEL